MARALGTRWILLWAGIWLAAAAGVPPVALAQDDEDEEALFEADEGDEEADDDRPDWDLPRVLIVAERYVPDKLVRNVKRLLENVGEQVSSAEYTREARSRGYPPTTHKAFSEVLPEMDVDLVIVVGGSRMYGRRHLKLTYREGEGGMVLLEEIHPLAGLKLTDSVKQRIQSEARLALAVMTRPKGGPAEPPTAGEGPRPGEVGPQEPGTAVHVGLSAGVGAGTRSFDLPAEAGKVRLSTSPFPAAGLRLRMEVEPVAQGRISFGGQLRYLTSVALRTTDTLRDGSNKKTDSRSQELDLVLQFRWRTADALDSVRLGVDAGYGFRLFSSEKPVTLPNFGLSGPLLRLSIDIPLLDEGRLVVGLGPELQYLLSIGDALRANGVASNAIAVGGQARARYEVTSALSVALLYREQHALLQSSMGSAKDISRFVLAQLVYRP